MRRSTVYATAAFAFALTVGVLAQERVDDATIARIKLEGFQHSQVMNTLFMLTDVNGPRLTGSAGFRKTAEWARAELERWGLAAAHLEPWGTFGPAWSVDRFSVEMTAPYYDRLIAYPLAWTPGTPGVVRGTPTLVEIASKDDFPKYTGKLKGAIVLLGRPSKPGSVFEAPGRRLTDAQLADRGHAMKPGEPSSFLAEDAEFEAFVKKPREIVQFLQNEGVAVLLEPSPRDAGVVEATALAYYMGTDPVFPAFAVSKEQYAHLVRLTDKAVRVTLEISLTTAFDRTDMKGYNVVAEIPGTDPALRDQVVMLGGHLDAWHSGTGAVDNGAGSAVALEAVRILMAIGVKPRRTIRLALWSGEEQGYFGSLGYVKGHFGDPATLQLKPEHAKLSAYFNLDNGSGRIRGINLQGNELARPIFEAWLKPFQYLEASTLTVLNTGGTDHMPFNGVGLPGFQFIQDPLDYGSRRHHTNIDVYEAASQDDLEQASVIMASFVYHAAMRDEMLPRVAMPKVEKKGS